MRPSFAFFLLALGLFGCTNPYDREGTEPFECRDGADNDEDGYYDCDDNGCWGSPDCEDGAGGDDTGKGEDTGSDTGGLDTDTGGLDTDTGGGDTGGADTDTALGGGDTSADTASEPCTWAHCDFASVQVDYDLQWLPWEQMSALGYAACTVHHVGTGVFVEADASRASFLGTWAVAEHDCTELDYGVVKDLVWVDTTGAAYHTFFFSGETTSLDDWFAHKQPRAFTVQSFNRWYITEIYATIDPSATAPSMHWTYVESVGDAWTDLGHDLTVTFAK